jgi:hypothetical protein
LLEAVLHTCGNEEQISAREAMYLWSVPKSSRSLDYYIDLVAGVRLLLVVLAGGVKLDRQRAMP